MSTHLRSQYQLFKGSGQAFQLQSRTEQIALQPGEVLVEILLATICGSDIHTIEGNRSEPLPLILGHEAVGTIVAINARPGFSIGDRVTWTIADSCGHCPACTQHALPEKCDELFKYGHASIQNGSGLNGCYATHIHIRKGTHLVKIPETLSNATVAPANCALATMINAVSHTNPKLKTVVVQGGGLLGLYACALLQVQGAAKVFCLEIKEERFSLIKQFGATAVDARNPKEATQFILDQLEGGVDIVFEVAGVKELIPQGVMLLRPGGAYILAGLVHPNSALDITAEQIIRKCLHIKGVHNYAPWHLEKAVSFLEQNHHLFPFEALVSPPYALAALAEAVEVAQSHTWLRVAVKPS